MGFLSSKQRHSSKKNVSHNFAKESIDMSNPAKITLAQAQSLVDQGAMSKKGFAKLVEEGQIKIFRFRTQDNKPQIVQDVHNNIVAMIEENAYPLYEAGFKPSIVWNKVNTDVEDTGEEAPAQ